MPLTVCETRVTHTYRANKVKSAHDLETYKQKPLNIYTFRTGITKGTPARNLWGGVIKRCRAHHLRKAVGSIPSH